MGRKEDNVLKKAAKAVGRVAAKVRNVVAQETPQREGKLPKKHKAHLPRKLKKAQQKAANAKAAKAA